MIPKESRSGWRYWEVADLLRDGVLDIGDGYRAKNSEMGESGLPFARAGNLNDGFHFDDADILRDQSVRLAGEKISKPGDITFTSKGTFGRFGIVRENTPQFVYSPQLCYWRVKREGIIDRTFLYYWMQGADCMNQLNEVKGLTDMADYVSLTNQRKMWLSAPPLPVQRRIAGILSAYDDLIENNQRRTRILEEMARALYREWFLQSPWVQGWPRKTLADFVTLKRGYDLPDRLRRPGAVPVVSSSGVTGTHDESKVAGPGLVTGRYGTLGEVHLVWEHFWPLNTSLYVTDFHETPLLYAYWLLRTVLRKQSGSAAAVPGVNRNHIHQLAVQSPPRELTFKFHSTIMPMAEQTRTLERQIQNLRRTRDLLLPRLLSGPVELETNEL